MNEILKSILYMARRFKLATIFNLLGLIVAIATCYLLLTQIIYQTTFNRRIEDVNRLYRMETDWSYEDWQFSDEICPQFAAVLDRNPQVESYSLIWSPVYDNIMNTLPFALGDSVVRLPFTKGNNTAVSTLTNRTVDGNITWTDEDQDGYLIPAKMALQYFGTTQAAGKDLLYCDVDNDKTVKPLRVRGVYEDFPKNSELWNCIYGNIRNDFENEISFNFKCILKFKSVPDDIDTFTSALKQTIADSICQNASRYCTNERDAIDLKERAKATKVKLTPLKYSYFEHATYTSSDKGYLSMLVILELACLIVAIVAAINFLNFTLAESPMRVRNVNTRRVLGASRSSLRMKLAAECVVTAVFACLMALVLCHLLSLTTWGNQLFTGSIALGNHWIIAIGLICVAALMGLVAGTYPACFATSFPPAMALNGNFGLTPQGKRLRTMLVCLQLTISMLMIIYIGILALQSHYIYNSTYGFDKDRVLVGTLPAFEGDKDGLKEALLQEPGIEDVSYSLNTLGSNDGGATIWINSKGHLIRYNSVTTDDAFLRVMGIKIIEGRGFEQSDSAVCVINEAARKAWDWINIGSDKLSIGSGEESGDSALVVGVCENIRYGTTRISNEKPFLIIANPSNPNLNSLNARISPDADVKKVKAHVRELLNRYFGENVTELTDFDNTLSSISYDNEFRYFNQAYFISIVCLIITLIGVFCLTMFETEFRRKEIGIRKVAGATSGEIIKMFCMHYIQLLLISFVIAAPLALLFGKLTLNHFAQRAHIHWWVFLLGLALVGGVTLCTVVLQSWRTARENPVNSIQSE